MKTLLFHESPIYGFGLILLLILIIVFYKKQYKKHIIISIVLFYALLLWFYRNPDKTNLNSTNIIIAPSYGTIKAIKVENNILKIATFLNVFDVHQQYYPINGKIKNIIYDNNGQFAIAFDLDKSINNEKKIHILDTAFGEVKITQIAGLLARTIVSNNKIGDEVKVGQHLGMIKFGSRVDIEIPNANIFNLNPNIKIDLKLIGGETQIGYY